MKKLLSVLVAAAFAVSSVPAIAASHAGGQMDKKDKGMQKKSSAMEKKSTADTKKEGKKKSSKKSEK